jgi:anti-sigma factor RsiW
MNDKQTPITDEDINAYVDGVLSEERRADVERALELDPALAQCASDYFSLNNLLHERYDRVLSEPLPAQLRSPAVARRRHAMNWPQFAGMAATLVLGVALGFGIQGRMGGAGQWLHDPQHSDTQPVSLAGSEMFAHRAALAHVVYMPAVERPLDMGEDREQEVVQMLAKRLGTDIHPPMLRKSGFELSGGRLLPGNDGPMAQFMYNNAAGERVTLLVSHRKASSNTTAFKLYMDGPVNVFYWVDGDFGYALSGGIDRDVLLALSHDVYAQLTGAAPG